mgnify:FL=1
MKLVQKKIVYRIASITNCDSDLQELLGKAIQATQVNERQQELNEYEKTFRTINQKWSYRGITMCEMVLIDPGASQPLAVYDESKGVYTIDAISTNELSQERLKRNSDFVNSMLYFGVKGNEVVIMPSQAINVRALENYLTWLLGEKLNLISNESKFALNKNIPRAVEEQIRSSPVRSIEIGSVLSGASDDDSEEFVSSESFSINAKSLLRVLGAKLKDELPFSISDDSNIRAKIVISYFRKTNDAGQNFMNHLGTTLRNLDDADVCVTLKNNVKISGEELNLQKVVKISKTDRGLLINDDISEAMVTWLLDLNEQRETL